MPPVTFSRLIARFRRWREARELARSLRSIRRHVEFFGGDVSYLPDEQLVERIIAFRAHVTRAGIDVNEFIRGLARLHQANKT